MRFHFPVIIIDEDFRSENASGLGIRSLAKALEDESMEVLGVTSYGDLSSFAQQQSRASAFILSVDDEEFAGDAAAQTIAELRTFVQEIRFRNADIPIFLYGETRTTRHISCRRERMRSPMRSPSVCSRAARSASLWAPLPAGLSG